MDKRVSDKIITEMPKEHYNEKIDIAYSDNDLLIVDNLKEIDPETTIRVGVTIIIFCTNGRCQIDFNGKTIKLGKNQMLICPPFTVMENPMTSLDYECKIMCMTNKILQTFLRPYINIWNQAIYINKLKVIEFPNEDMGFFMKFYDLLKHCIDKNDVNKYKKEIVGTLLQSGLLGLCGILEEKMNCDESPNRSYTENTFRKFLELLDTNGSRRHTVIYYADQLFITPKYLSLICSKHSGKTAKEWIQDYVMENVRYYLRSTDMSIKEISDKLGFPNASYLGRYVKERFGVSPMTYRNSNTEIEKLK